GTGVQTVLSQIAAEELGISPDRVETRWGDTDLPATGPTYGSSTTMGTDSAGTPYAIRTWGVIFTEVGVDPDFGLLRLRRAVGVYSAGRIVNPVTARA